MTTEVKLMFALFLEPFLLWNCRRNSCVEGGGGEDGQKSNLLQFHAHQDSLASLPVAHYSGNARQKLMPNTGIMSQTQKQPETCEWCHLSKWSQSPSFTIKVAALSAEHSCYPSSKTSFQSRKNVMTEKDIYCLAFISIFPKQKATILGCSV